jgi:hypothetical protein
MENRQGKFSRFGMCLIEETSHKYPGDDALVDRLSWSRNLQVSTIFHLRILAVEFPLKKLVT